MQKQKHFKQDNAGRSLTEMLGVLAVMGVLVIGGIAGYKIAMNHYIANQIAYEANILRNDIHNKLLRGIRNLTFDAPYDTGHLKYDAEYGFNVTCLPLPEDCTNATGYKLHFSNVPGNICPLLNQLLVNMGGKTEINPVAENEHQCQSESNQIYVTFSPTDLNNNTSLEAQGDCQNDTCSGHCTAQGQCVPDCTESSCVNPTPYCNPDTKDCEQCKTDSQCHTAKNEHCQFLTGECVICKADEIWDSDQSRCVSTDCHATKNCPAGYFCLSKGCASCDGNHITENCSSYTCVALKAHTTTEGSITLSNGIMNRWSADRFCDAHHQNVMAVSDLECADNIMYTGGDCQTGPCLPEGSDRTCHDAGTTTDVSAMITKIRGLWTNQKNSFWMNEAYAEKSERNSCEAYDMYLYDGTIYHYPRNGELYVVCK